jgi:hypothetical protein
VEIWTSKHIKDNRIGQTANNSKPFAIVLDEPRVDAVTDGLHGLRGVAEEIYRDFCNHAATQQNLKLEGMVDWQTGMPEFGIPNKTTGQIVRISISHEDDYAVATAIAPTELADPFIDSDDEPKKPDDDRIRPDDPDNK